MIEVVDGDELPKIPPSPMSFIPQPELESPIAATDKATLSEKKWVIRKVLTIIEEDQGFITSRIIIKNNLFHIVTQIDNSSLTLNSG